MPVQVGWLLFGLRSRMMKSDLLSMLLRSWASHRKKWPTTKIEMLALNFGTECFFPYLVNKKFTARLDHWSLVWLLNFLIFLILTLVRNGWPGRVGRIEEFVKKIMAELDVIMHLSMLSRGEGRAGLGILIRHSYPREWLLTLRTRPRVRIFDFSLSRGRAVWSTSPEWNESMLYLIYYLTIKGY